MVCCFAQRRAHKRADSLWQPTRTLPKGENYEYSSARHTACLTRFMSLMRMEAQPVCAHSHARLSTIQTAQPHPSRFSPPPTLISPMTKLLQAPSRLSPHLRAFLVSRTIPTTHHTLCSASRHCHSLPPLLPLLPLPRSFPFHSWLPHISLRSQKSACVPGRSAAARSV
jgi:hypothetical protein